MSLKVGYCVFYVGFLSILVFLSANMGIDIVSADQEDLFNLPSAPPPGNLFAALTFLFELTVFGVLTFGFLVTTTTEFLFLTVFVILPLSTGFLWALVELARGN